MDGSVINYEFEAKVISDWNLNSVKDPYPIDLIGYYGFENAGEAEFRLFKAFYRNLMNMFSDPVVKRDNIWRGNVDVLYDVLEEVWSDYQRQYNPEGYGKKKFVPSFTPEGFNFLLNNLK